VVRNAIADKFSAVTQLKALAKKHPSYASLAQIFSEPAFKQYDIKFRTSVGQLRAHGGYADVYEGLLLAHGGYAYVDDS
jgi:hypothetical protein